VCAFVSILQFANTRHWVKLAGKFTPPFLSTNDRQLSVGKQHQDCTEMDLRSWVMYFFLYFGVFVYGEWSLFLVVGASSGLDGYIKLWDMETGKLLKSIDGGPGVGVCVGVSLVYRLFGLYLHSYVCMV